MTRTKIDKELEREFAIARLIALVEEVKKNPPKSTFSRNYLKKRLQLMVNKITKEE